MRAGQQPTPVRTQAPIHSYGSTNAGFRYGIASGHDQIRCFRFVTLIDQLVTSAVEGSTISVPGYPAMCATDQITGRGSHSTWQ